MGGTTTMNRQALKKLKPKDQIKLWNIAVGDSVRVLSGPSKGRIGKVQECLREQNKLIVSGVNIVTKTLPLFLSQSANLESQRFEYASPIHYSNVQLVGEIPDVNNPSGPKKEVTLKRVHRGKLFYNKDKRLLTWRRWIPGESMFLPWPRNEKTKPKGPMDTQEADVLSNTYLETLHQPPIPISVQHELRNKYSKFRREPMRVNPPSVNVAAVEGIQEVKATTPKPSAGGTGPLKGMSPETINILAQAMKSSRIKSEMPN